MKRFSALIATTFIALDITTGALADTRQCDCACQCETPASPASFSVSPTAIAKPPPPQVQEAANGELDVRLLNSADVTVELKYPEIANGHTAGLYWTSGIQQYRTPVQTVKDDAKSVIFKIPNASVMNDLGQTVTLTASVGVGSDRLVISEPQTIKVINSTPVGQYPPPTVGGAPGNQVDIGALTGDLTVSVYYPPVMAAGQIARVLWRGATAYETAPRNVPDGNPLEFTIPHATVLASLGTPVTVSYEVTVDGQPSQPSDTTTLHIKLQTVDAAPVVPSANGDQLDLKNLAGQPLKVTYTYNGIAAGHTVGIRWAGNPVYDTPHPVIGATPRPLEFTIPYDKVKLEKDKTVQLTASVGIGDGQLAVSPSLALKVIDTRPRGEEVAADLNARYNDTRAACDNNTPSYYCSGVTTRGTANGNFDPWDPSPTQLKKGSVSVSHIRKDSKVTYLWQNSGYVLLSQNEAIRQGKAQEYLCGFPHDGATDLGRLAYGCGFAPKTGRAGEVAGRLLKIATEHPKLFDLLKQDEQLVDQLANGRDANALSQQDPALAAILGSEPELGSLLRENLDLMEAANKASVNVADPSTCAGVGANTLATWLPYTSRLTHRVQQCSLSAQKVTDFSVLMQARQQPIRNEVFSTWNELLIKVWAAGTPSRLPLQAFYYQNPTGLPEARVYQQKYASRTGGQWLPVIKLDAAKMAAGTAPFSYSTADQAIQP
ncbi:hypothetical protein OKW98_24035 [Pseudomonas sp. KU26590]|uniref:hypothetical protein n=1 Tax=Pseudomonas sp. KU26590 TaxID=2991051 RepID=UPI00223DF2CB|nr:hypothetical protein [Pseudomonas sp. KU26590]UZJ59578.1 hypothetical protein OKW98_24035 [Pseudomonas sp. KU26590]